MLQVICLNLQFDCNQKLNDPHIRHHDHDKCCYTPILIFRNIINDHHIGQKDEAENPRLRSRRRSVADSRTDRFVIIGTICRKAEIALGQSLGPRGADRPRAQIHLATPEAFRQTVILFNFRKS